MRYADLISTLGYAGAPLFCEDHGAAHVALSDRHWLRDARAAGVRGSYLFRTSPDPGSLRAAVHVAEAGTVEEARQIHRRLWNQGVNPFVIIILPGQVRAFTGFAYHPDFTREDSGEICAGLEETASTYTAVTSNFPGPNPFPVDVIVGKDGIVRYAAHEYDPDAMATVIEQALAE